MSSEHGEMCPDKIYGPYITAGRLGVLNESTVSNLQEVFMTDFQIEDEKDAIQTKPSYPGCFCKQPISLHSPRTMPVHNSQEVEGMLTPVDKSYVKAPKGNCTEGREERSIDETETSFSFFPHHPEGIMTFKSGSLPSINRATLMEDNS